MDFQLMTGFDVPFFSTLQDMMMLDAVSDDIDHQVVEKSVINTPTKKYVRDAKAMAATPADIKEYPDSYVFVIDMPGLKREEIRVQVEDNNVLMVSGIRKREEETADKNKDDEGVVKYVRMERRMGKLMRKFVVPENANIDSISAVYQDGVLTITVQKLPPPEPKKPKAIEVKIC